MKVTESTLLDLQRRHDWRLCLCLAAFLVFVWIGTGLYLVFSSPFRSGTDESINYVAFAAVHKRWATESDFRESGINFYYYPPLYFLLFSLWPASSDLLTDPGLAQVWYEANYQYAGGTVMVDPAVSEAASAELVALYRAARLASLTFGVLVIASLMAGLHLLGLWKVAPFHSLLVLVALLCLPQFLYYSTLCNNDSLLNALAALAALFFILHFRSRTSAQTSWQNERWLLAIGVVTGLALLTKQTGVLLLLLLGAALCHSIMSSPPERRMLRGLFLTFVAILIVLLMGGWWYLRLALLGDPLGLKAARNAHDWAFLDQPLWQMWGWQRLLVTLWRTSYGLFTGPVHGLPDQLVAGYGLLSLTLVGVAGVGLIGSLRRKPFTSHGLLITTFAAFVVINVFLVIVNCRTVLAPYGRLLFPSLVPLSILIALGFGQIAHNMQGRLRFVPLIGCAIYLALMASALTTRLYPAVRQEREYLFPFIHPGAQALVMPQPASEVLLIQPLQIPAGTLTAVRMHVIRDMGLHLGGGVRATLMVDAKEHRLKSTPYSTTDGTEKWMSLDLAEPRNFPETTDAVLLVEGSPAWTLLAGMQPRFAVSDHKSARNAGRLQVNGKSSELALRVALEYAAPPVSEALPLAPLTP